MLSPFHALLLTLAIAFNPDAEEPSDPIGQPLFRLANSDQYDDAIPDLVLGLCKGVGLQHDSKDDVTFAALLMHARHVNDYNFVEDAARDDRDRALIELVKLADNADAFGRFYELHIDRLITEDGELRKPDDEDEADDLRDGDIEPSPLIALARSLEPWIR